MIMLTKFDLKAQGLSQLKACTSHACIEKWLVSWEKSFTSEVKALGKLQNRSNRSNRIVQVSERYQLPSYGYSKGPIRAWVRDILQEKDCSEEKMEYYLKKLDDAQDRLVKICQDEMRGH